MLALIPLFLSPALTPQNPQPFTEEAIARGINFPVVQGVTVSGAGRGVALVDLDGDGDPDLVALGSPAYHVGVYENLGDGTFFDRSRGSGIPILPEASGVIAADYDADGDLDLHIACLTTANRLMRNDGNFDFTDVTVAMGLGDTGRGSGCAFADVDGDGWLDLYVANSGGAGNEPDRLFRNMGGLGFVDATAWFGLPDTPTITWQAVFFDFDRDADQDLYISVDKCPITGRNRLYENVNGTFVDVSTASGADICIDSMGVAVGDITANGFQDLYCTNTSGGGNPLLLNLGGGSFVETTRADVGSFALGWGAVFFDYDNDGTHELYVNNQIGAHNRLYKFDTQPTVDLAPSLGVESPGFSYCSATGDVDGDGDLDLLVQNFFVPLKLYINHEGEQRNWIKFDVKGYGNQAVAIGARIDLTVGASVQMREIRSGSSFKSQDELTAHFGLGSATLVDQVVITWPGGATRTLTDLAVGQTHVVSPP